MRSRRLVVLLTGLLLVGLPGTVAAQDGLVAHEWGSILQVQSSDGTGVGGGRENLREMPPFVLRWSTVPMSARVYKMKKPILYFYAKRPMTLKVKVSAPTGMFTEWWPPAHEFAPRIGTQRVVPRNGWLEWRNVQLTPDPPTLQPQEAPGSSWYPILRDVDAAWLQVKGRHYSPSSGGSARSFAETERFLLYRGVIDRSQAIEVKVKSTDEKVTLHNTGQSRLGKAVLVGVSDGTGWMEIVELPAPGAKLELKTTGRKSVATAELAKRGIDAMSKIAEAAGLFRKEARGMSRIWSPQWFKQDGMRVLYLLPPAKIDRLIPLEIKPAPSKTVRVLVANIETLTPDREAEVLTWIHKLNSRSWKDRRRAADALKKLGQLAEPLLRGALKSADDLETRARIEQLLRHLEPTSRRKS